MVEITNRATKSWLRISNRLLDLMLISLLCPKQQHGWFHWIIAIKRNMYLSPEEESFGGARISAATFNCKYFHLLFVALTTNLIIVNKLKSLFSPARASVIIKNTYVCTKCQNRTSAAAWETILREREWLLVDRKQLGNLFLSFFLLFAICVLLSNHKLCTLTALCDL